MTPSSSATRRRSVLYAAVSGLAMIAGWPIAVATGARAGEAAVALLAAWGIQIGVYAVLENRLGRRQDATRAWIAGMALRGGALMTLAVASMIGLLSRSAFIVFGLGLTLLILLEAVCLATIRPAPFRTID